MYIDGGINIGMTNDKHFVISIRVVSNTKKSKNEDTIEYPISTEEKVIIAKDTNDLMKKLKIILKHLQPNKGSLDMTEAEFEKTFNQITQEG